MYMEGGLAMQIKSNTQSMVKLMTANILLLATREKVNMYMQKNADIFQEMLEDEEALDFMNLYFEENQEELRNAAEESVLLANEIKVLELMGEIRDDQQE
jgi:hypothetical protein